MLYEHAQGAHYPQELKLGGFSPLLEAALLNPQTSLVSAQKPLGDWGEAVPDSELRCWDSK